MDVVPEVLIPDLSSAKLGLVEVLSVMVDKCPLLCPVLWHLDGEPLLDIWRDFRVARQILVSLDLVGELVELLLAPLGLHWRFVEALVGFLLDDDWRSAGLLLESFELAPDTRQLVERLAGQQRAYLVVFRRGSLSLFL